MMPANTTGLKETHNIHPMSQATPLTIELIFAKLEESRRANNIEDHIYWMKILDSHKKFEEETKIREKLLRAERQMAQARKQPQCDYHYVAKLSEYIIAARAALNKIYAE